MRSFIVKKLIPEQKLLCHLLVTVHGLVTRHDILFQVRHRGGLKRLFNYNPDPDNFSTGLMNQVNQT